MHLVVRVSSQFLPGEINVRSSPLSHPGVVFPMIAPKAIMPLAAQKEALMSNGMSTTMRPEVPSNPLKAIFRAERGRAVLSKIRVTSLSSWGEICGGSFKRRKCTKSKRLDDWRNQNPRARQVVE